MDLIPNTGDTAKAHGSLPFCCLAALVTVSAMQWIPVLSMFFAVPLFVVYYSYGKGSFVFTTLFSFIAGVASSLVAFLLKGSLPDQGFTGALVAASGFMLVPLLVVAFPGTLKLRFRVLLAALVSSLAWAWLFLATPEGKVLDGLIREFSSELSGMLANGLPEGYDKDIAASSFSPDGVYGSFREALLYTFFTGTFCLYASAAWIARSLVARFGKRGVRPFRVAYFSVEPFFFFPLVIGMCGAIANRFSPSPVLSAVSWNLALSSGFFFALQGMGILSVTLAWLRARKGVPMALLIAGLVVICLVGWVYLIGLLLVAGVVELFVPLRARMLNKDAVDPTPGSGGENQ